MINKTTITIVLVALVLVASTYIYKNIGREYKSPNTEQVNQISTTTNQVVDDVQKGEITFNSKVKQPVPVLKFKEGNKVMLYIQSDIVDEAHLHGYDISTELPSQSTSKLEFTANKSGRFPIELEKNGTEIGIIEIYPN
jgi:FtsP/CotA-like multicopper oxidase with cupredoxin domain